MIHKNSAQVVVNYFRNLFVLLAKIPRNIWLLAIACMLISVSAAMSFSIAPHYLRDTLHIDVKIINSLDGISEGLSLVLRLLVGVIIDYTRRKKNSFIVGFGLAIISKPLFIMANGIFLIGLSNFIERSSNGVIAVARDMYAVTAVDKNMRGTSIGAVMSLKVLGVSVGSFLVAYANRFFGDIQVLWLGVVVSILGLMCLAFVKEDKFNVETVANKEKITVALKKKDGNSKLSYFVRFVSASKFIFSHIKQLSFSYWFAVLVFLLCTATRFNDGNLMFRYTELGGL